MGEPAERSVSSGSVLVIGAGGLGCGAILGLVAAGVGRIGVIDEDVVDESNLHRQVLHDEARVGWKKTASLRHALAERAPGIKVVTHEERFAPENAAALLRDYDVLLDGSDNLGTKFLANDVAVLLGKPLVHAAAVGNVGQLVSVPPGGRPCYRCLFEELPAAEADAPSCAEAGVLGPVPGLLGALQASEALHFLRGETPAYVGRLLQYDAFELSLRVATFRRNRACRVCGDHPDISQIIPGNYPGPGCI